MILYVVAGCLVIFNILYTYTVITDKVNYSAYLKKMEKNKEARTDREYMIIMLFYNIMEMLI